MKLQNAQGETLEAVQWNGSMEEIKAFLGTDLPPFDESSGTLRVETPGGVEELRRQDWLVKDRKDRLSIGKHGPFEEEWKLLREPESPGEEHTPTPTATPEVQP